MKFSQFLLFATLALVFLPTQANAVFAVVNNSPACVNAEVNYSSIQAAVSNSSAGDYIIVCESITGRWSQNVVINQSVNITGITRTILVNATSNTVPVFNVTANNVRINNFTLEDSNGTNGVGIYVTGNNTLVTNTTSRNNFFGYVFNHSVNNTILDNNASSNIGTFGFEINSMNNSNMTTNFIYNQTGGANTFAIRMQNSDFNNLTSNSIIDNHGSGANIVNGSENNTIAHNTWARNNISGLLLVGNQTRFNTVFNNSIFGHANNRGFSVSGENNNISFNRAWNNTVGFRVTTSLTGEANFSTFLANQAFNNSIAGIQFVIGTTGTAGGNITVVDNLIFGNPTGIMINSSFGLVIRNNIISNNTIGINATDGSDYNFTNNTVTNHTIGILLSGGNGHTLTSNNVTNAVYGLSLNGTLGNFLNRTTVTGMRITNATTQGILVNYTTRVMITDSVISNATTGIAVPFNVSNVSITNTNLSNSTTVFINVGTASNAYLIGTINLTTTQASSNEIINGADSIINMSSTSRIFTDFAIYRIDQTNGLRFKSSNTTLTSSDRTGCALPALYDPCLLISNHTGIGVMSVTALGGDVGGILTMFYNISELAANGATTANVQIGQYSSPDWVNTGRTSISASEGSVTNTVNLAATYGAVIFIDAPPGNNIGNVFIERFFIYLADMIVWVPILVLLIMIWPYLKEIFDKLTKGRGLGGERRG